MGFFDFLKKGFTSIVKGLDVRSALYVPGLSTQLLIGDLG
jgi:hypothetical protein